MSDPETRAAFRALLDETRKTNALLERLVVLLEAQTELTLGQAQATLEAVTRPDARPFEEWPSNEDGCCPECGHLKVSVPDVSDATHEGRVCAECHYAWRVPKLIGCPRCGSRSPALYTMCGNCGQKLP